MDEHPNQAFIDGLRELADFLEANPQNRQLWDHQVFHFFAQSKEEFAQALRDLSPCSKEDDGSFVEAIRSFGPVRVVVNLNHDKGCERIVIGTKVLPAEPEKTVVIPAKPERVEEIVEWKCPESFLALSKEE